MKPITFSAHNQVTGENIHRGELVLEMRSGNPFGKSRHLI